MKIFSASQVKEIDGLTVRNEPVASIDLMERASAAVTSWLKAHIGRENSLVVFTGPGNNGGDGLAIARMLGLDRYKTDVFHIAVDTNASVDWEVNRRRLQEVKEVSFTVVDNIGKFPHLEHNVIIIDAIFGSGLSRPVSGLAAEVIKRINNTGNRVVSIDIPSGLFMEDNGNNDPENIVKASVTLSFEFPKLSFLFTENYQFTGTWHLLPINLDRKAIESIDTPYIFTDNDLVFPLLKKRHKFDHKGTYGHGLLISGSYGKMGAAILGAAAALRSGIGLVTCQIPGCGYHILQGALPEAMVIPCESERYISGLPDIDTFRAVGIGPGIGKEPKTAETVKSVLRKREVNMVIDADALNIISENSELYDYLRDGMILTPHIKEFERLAGEANDSYQRLRMQRDFSGKYKCVVILKGAYTSVSSPDGSVYFNSTGNPGMATAGSGDVLTGILLSLLAQGYSPVHAAVTGVFLHGLAGDISAGTTGYEALTARDIISNLGEAYKKIRQYNNYI